MKLKKEKGTVSPAESWLLGLLFLFLFGEAASCIAIKMESSFSFYCKLLGIMAIVSGAVSLLFSYKQMWKMLPKWKQRKASDSVQENEKKLRRYRGSKWMLTILLLLPFIGYACYVPYTAGDTTAETVLVTVASDTVFGYNPVTGMVLEYGMYPIYKLASLPLMYSALYELSGGPLEIFLYYAVPFFVLAASFVVMHLWGRLLFEEQKEKRCLFLLFLCLLIVTGDGEKTSFAYRLLHEGWKGTTVASAVILPFGIYMGCRMFWKKEWLYGAVGVVLSAVGILFTRPLFLPESFAFTVDDTGKNWCLLLLAVFALYLIREKTKKKWKLKEAIGLGFCLLVGLVSGNIFLLLGTAYVGTCIWSVAEERNKAVPLFIGMTILICMSGTVLPFRGEATKRWDVPQNEAEIQNKIAELAEDYGETVVLLAPEGVMEQARMQNSKVTLPYGKDLWYENCNREIADVYTEKEILLFEQMKTDYLQPDTIAAMAAEAHCDILVMRERMSEDAAVRNGWKETEGVTGYAVYCK